MFNFIPETMLGGFHEPPTLYSIMESMVNYGKEEKIRIADLSKEARKKIFDFDYPLSQHINKEDFECMILNHFIMRRIGYEMYLPFKIALENKIKIIMPFYNKMFDMLEGWDIFESGEKYERIVEDTRTTNNATSTNTSANTLANSTGENKNSETPQNQLQDVRDGIYVDNFDYRTSQDSRQDSSNSSGTSKTQDNGRLKETTLRSPSDKMKLYNDFIENKTHIYNMIFAELNPLFYGLV